MNYVIQWDVAERDVGNGDEVLEFFVERAGLVNNWGTRGMTYWLGPAGAEPEDFPLRVDIDPDAEAAAIRWLPDDLVGVDTEFHQNKPIHVLEDSGDPLVEIPAELVCTSIDTAKKVAAEYVETGQRPTCVDWVPID